ncbi:T9SS C-terminal target domain-containing protein [bacterium]|nr:MAG: T9SS C-terminal target domain-containing protein [bacterium]
MRRRNTVFTLVMLLVVFTMAAWTYPSGFTSATRKTGGSGCAGCHSGSSIDGVVAISGPTSLKVGQAGTYTLTISSGTLIGCDIAASSGALAKVSSALKLVSGELTHSQRMTGTSVQFTWTPSAAGSEVLYAAGARTSKNGGWGHAGDLSVTDTHEGLSGIEEKNSPAAFSLDQNFPNPFNPSTTIRFTLPRSADVSLTVVNLIGEEVATLVSRRMEQGTHAVQWDASGVPSGMYFYRLEARQEAEGSGQPLIQTRKLLLLK